MIILKKIIQRDSICLKNLKIIQSYHIELGSNVSDFYDYSIVSNNIKLSLFVPAKNVTNFLQLYDQKVLLSLKKFGFTKIINKLILMDKEKRN